MRESKHTVWFLWVPADISSVLANRETMISVRSPDGKLTLFCKGADTIIFERLNPSCDKLKKATTGHLNVSSAVGAVGAFIQTQFGF